MSGCLARFIDYLWVKFFVYLVLSKFKCMKLDIPGNKMKGVILSFDIETWSDRCGGRFEASADPGDEYFRYLPELLDLLKDYSIKAHFFVCGKVLELYPEAIRAVVKRGHGIGGHGYDHETMYGLSSEEQRNIVRKVGSLMYERLGTGLRSWRCPGLDANRETYRVLNEFGIRFTSNARWGKPMPIEDVVEVPLVGKMDGQIYGWYGIRKSPSPEKWANYMKKQFDRASSGILVFGMHTWVQKKYDPKYEALMHFLDFLDSYKSEVWIGRFDDL